MNKNGTTNNTRRNEVLNIAITETLAHLAKAPSNLTEPDVRGHHSPVMSVDRVVNDILDGLSNQPVLEEIKSDGASPRYQRSKSESTGGPVAACFGPEIEIVHAELARQDKELQQLKVDELKNRFKEFNGDEEAPRHKAELIHALLFESPRAGSGTEDQSEDEDDFVHDHEIHEQLKRTSQWLIKNDKDELKAKFFMQRYRTCRDLDQPTHIEEMQLPRFANQYEAAHYAINVLTKEEIQKLFNKDESDVMSREEMLDEIERRNTHQLTVAVIEKLVRRNHLNWLAMESRASREGYISELLFGVTRINLKNAEAIQKEDTQLDKQEQTSDVVTITSEVPPQQIAQNLSNLELATITQGLTSYLGELHLVSLPLGNGYPPSTLDDIETMRTLGQMFPQLSKDSNQTSIQSAGVQQSAPDKSSNVNSPQLEADRRAASPKEEPTGSQIRGWMKQLFQIFSRKNDDE